MDLVIGQVYEVSCAQLRWDDGRDYFVPVINHFHADPQFGLEAAHYHIDGRFEMEPRIKHHFRLVEGRTSAVIVKQCGSYELKGIGTRELTCTGLATGLKLPDSGDQDVLYADWYAGYVGTICKGRRCPHFGTEMLEKKGMLVCPLHELRADAQTLKILPLEAGNVS